MTVAERVDVSVGGGEESWFRRHQFEIWLTLPLVAYVLVLTVAPIVNTFRISFTDPNEGGISLTNYETILGQPVFRDAVTNTLIVAAISLVLELGLGLIIALTLHAPFRGRGFVRTISLGAARRSDDRRRRGDAADLRAVGLPELR